MKTITILIAMLFSTVAFANDYAPERNDRINLYKVTSDNENAPMYSGYYKDSDGVVPVSYTHLTLPTKRIV